MQISVHTHNCRCKYIRVDAQTHTDLGKKCHDVALGQAVGEAVLLVVRPVRHAVPVEQPLHRAAAVAF